MSILILKKRKRGQTAIETAFVFSSIIFLTFTLSNLGILIHTRNIATYAAFMSARSYQVFGDQSYKQDASGFGNVEPYFEIGPNGQVQPLLGDLKIAAALRVAEDLYTCSLPWMTVPAGDREGVMKPPEPGKPHPPEDRCMEGKRKYEKLNVGKNLDFLTFKDPSGSPNNTQTNLELVEGGYRERGTNRLTKEDEFRDPLRYGILRLRYRTPLLFNPMGSFASEDGNKLFGIFEVNGNGEFVSDAVYVPALINPGLSTGLQDKKSEDKEFDDQ